MEKRVKAFDDYIIRRLSVYSSTIKNQDEIRMPNRSKAIEASNRKVRTITLLYGKVLFVT